MNPYEVLVRPILSEKSNKTRENQNKYTFQVNLAAGKNDIKKALEKMYDIKIEDVHTAIRRGKIRRRGMFITKRPTRTKRAVVTLAKDSKIPLFEDL